MSTGTEWLQLDNIRGDETILLVEDEDSLRFVICDFLSQLGYKLLSAASGEEGVGMGEAYPGHIDLLLTDVSLPGMAGPEVAEKLLTSRPSLKIIYVSGYTECTVDLHGILIPGTVLLQKPFTIKSLTLKVREVLDRNGDKT